MPFGHSRQATEAGLWTLPLVDGAGEDRSDKSPAGVGHVIEADVLGDCLVFGIRENEVRGDGLHNPGFR